MTLENEISSYVDSIPFFDTHSHVAGFDFGTPLDDRGGKSLPQLLMNDYLLYLAGSVASDLPRVDNDAWSVERAEGQWAAIRPLMPNYRAMTSYVPLREGIRELHGIDGDDLDEDNWQAVNESVVATYREHGEREWHRRAMRRVNVVRQNQMVVLPYVVDHWDALPAAERATQRRLIAPSLILDGYLFTGFSSGKPSRVRSLELVNASPRTHAEYVDAMAKILDLFKQRGGSSVKLLTAYHRPLRFEEVSDADAAALFAKGPETLSHAELIPLQDNLCWHLLEMSRDRGLPLIVHCGYSTPTSSADAAGMYNLVKSRRLKGLKIDICHSNWPHEGEAMIMSRTYRGAYFNLCWTHVLSDALGRRVLSEVIDIVPMNKILTGTDCGSVECFVGAARMVRSQLSRVLAEKVRDKLFSVDVARNVAKAILLDNPCEYYGVKPEDLRGAEPAAEREARPLAASRIETA